MVVVPRHRSGFKLSTFSAYGDPMKAPLDHQSGKTDKTKKIFGGRKDVRNCLYMAAIPTIRSNHILGPYYEQVKKRAPGPKAAKWAVVPVLRKLLFLMNRLARDPNFELQLKPQTKAA